MNKKLLNIGLCALLFLGQQSLSFGQIRQEKKASKQIEKYAYSDAINTYKRIIDNGRADATVYAKLANAYYFNAKLVEAHPWYAKYFEQIEDNKIEGIHLFRYAQTLKAVGQTQKADELLKQWANDFATTDAKYYVHDNKGLAKDKKVVSLALAQYNSDSSDFGAANLGDTTIFTSSRSREGKQIDPWTNESFTSLYQIDSDHTNKVEPFVLQGELNTVNYSTAIFTKDGSVMFFTANSLSEKGKKKYNKENSSLLKIFKASKLGEGKWGQVEELSINSDDFNTAHPSLSSDEKYLYFSSDRPGGYGQSDIYKIALENLKPIGNPINLGPMINTSGRETYPFITDGSLFFSSDARLGYGGLDIFKVDLPIDQTKAITNDPINLGEQFNSAFDDFAYYQTNTNKGYLSSNRPAQIGSDNIYYFNTCAPIFKGSVKDELSLKALDNSLVELYDKQKSKVGVLYTNQMGEFYTDDLICEQQYTVVFKSEGYNPKTLVIQFEGDNPVVQRDILLQLKDKPWQNIVFDPIYFSFDESVIRQDAIVILDKIQHVLTTYPTIKIQIQSHTDSRGSAAYNMDLSQKRAQQTAQWLIKNGVDSQRITTKAMGETMLLNRCKDNEPCTAAEHALNRRSEFKIIEK
ncbi:MAG: OmpA family protein [Flavobacteriaceae bacterium]|jgi:outer membrane protein OmpA-like peptidoglycan-associated protein|nr:OmpA family protein [Flavobacteriaceae bacterium]